MKCNKLPHDCEIDFTVISSTCPVCGANVAGWTEMMHCRHYCQPRFPEIIEVIPPESEEVRLEIYLEDCLELDRKAALQEPKRLLICPATHICNDWCNHREPHEEGELCTYKCHHRYSSSPNGGPCVPATSLGMETSEAAATWKRQYTDSANQVPLNDWMTLADGRAAVARWHNKHYTKEIRADREAYLAAYFYAMGRRDQAGAK